MDVAFSLDLECFSVRIALLYHALPLLRDRMFTCNLLQNLSSA